MSRRPDTGVLVAAEPRRGNGVDGAGGPLGKPETRPGIAGTAYDTAWLASIPAQGNGPSPRFPQALQWLLEHQLPDGSWGGQVHYVHDRVLSTLAALVPLARFGRNGEYRERIEAGVRYLWQHGHRLAAEPMELVGFELLLPTLIERARHSGIPVPPHLDIYGAKRAEKLRLVPAEAVYSPRTTIVHSLEFLGDQASVKGLLAAQGANGAIGNSPAATAFFLSYVPDRRALTYLEGCVAPSDGGLVPVLHPCETYELLWAAYHLFLAATPVAVLLTPEERESLRRALRTGGVSLSSSFPIPDADNTAVALLLLHELGEPVDPGVLQPFATPEGHFVSFPHERHSSVGVNLHVLHALLRVPGYPDRDRTVARLLSYLEHQQVGGLYWYDKWHISPYYATAHALQVLAELPSPQAARMRPLMERSREWLRQTQNPDGSWGFYGHPTLEETAYGVLGLVAGGPGRLGEADARRCTRAIRYLAAATGDVFEGSNGRFPPMWIDKCLYTPTLVVRSVIKSAFTAYERCRTGS